MPKPTNRNYRYIPGLDGLRAAAVLAVIAYHFGMPWAQGGFLGVEMFFVLSGYLITDILIADRQQYGRIRLGAFWRRRARRLLPALLTMLAAVSFWLWITDESRLTQLGGDLLSAILYVNNWWLIFHKVSYFESFGPPSPFGHLWSLAVEEQFYVVWPLFVALALRWLKRRGALAVLALAVAALSAFAMWLLYTPGTDPSRVYYGTDTRAFGMLIGAAAALLLPSGRLSDLVRGRGLTVLDALGGIGLLTALAMILGVGEYDAFLYPGGFLLLAAATVAVVAAVVHKEGRLGRLLGIAPLRWIGVRSYGIYLWHYPVFVLTSPPASTEGPDYGRMALQLALTLGLAALSWRWIEQPVRTGVFGRNVRLLLAGNRAGIAAAAAAGLLLLGALCANIADKAAVEVAAPETGPIGMTDRTETQPPESPQDGRPSDAPVLPAGLKPAGPAGTAELPAQPSATPAPPGRPGGSGPDARPSPPAGGGPDASAGSGADITVIGDSIILGVAPYLEERLPGIRVDGEKGRQLYDAPELIEEMRKEGTLGSKVVIELGTNGTFSAKQLNRLLDSLGQAERVVLINTRVPRKWQNNVNAALKKAAEERENVELIDWYAASKNHDDYFYPDGVHLKPEGAKAYAALIIESVKPQA